MDSCHLFRITTHMAPFLYLAIDDQFVQSTSSTLNDLHPADEQNESIGVAVQNVPTIHGL